MSRIIMVFLCLAAIAAGLAGTGPTQPRLVTGQVLSRESELLASLGLFHEFMIDTVSRNRQLNPAVAFGGSNYLVVWQDYRDGLSDIYAARVDTLGNVLDPSGIPICTADDQQISPDVAFSGTNYIVVWSDGGYYHNPHAKCAVLDTDGQVLDTFQLPVPRTRDSSYGPSIACGETNCMAAWIEDLEETSFVHCTRLYHSGGIQDSFGTLLDKMWTNPLGWEYSPTGLCVSAGSGNYLITYVVISSHFGHWTVGQVIDTSGVRVTDFSFAGDNEESNAASAFDGVNYLALWSAWGNDRNIYGRRIDGKGPLLGPRFNICTADSWQEGPCIAFNGIEYICAWDDRRNGGSCDIWGTRIDTTGTLIDSSGVELVNDQHYLRQDAAIATGHGTQMLLVYKGFGFAPGPYATERIFGAIWRTVGVAEAPNPCVRRSEPVLYQNSPNPFDKTTSVTYVIPGRSNVSLRICDSSGRVVRVLADEERDAGRYLVLWDGRDELGHALPSGVYFCRMNAPKASLTRKMVLLR